MLISAVEVLNKAKTPPFEINEEIETQVTEDLRLKYRYMDLRRDRMRENIIFRSKLSKFVRDFYDEK